MREIQFIKKNNTKWQKIENLFNTGNNANPDELADLYIETIDDLSFARTYFPNSKTTIFLNQLTAKTHQRIFKSKKENYRRIITFWTQEAPLVYFSLRKALLISFLITIAGAIIGGFSAYLDDSYIRLILSDSYVNMTIENIKNGDPMGVYKNHSGDTMFGMISVNNIMVALQTFVMGVVFCIGAAYVLFKNGVMLGAFIQFFAHYGCVGIALKTIWLHGVLEISSIIMAGAAGLNLGASFMFPKTYSRRESFLIGAKVSLKVAMSLVPIFIVAALIESFVTRYSDMPIWLSLMIIILSLIFIIEYFVIYPNKISKKELVK